MFTDRAISEPSTGWEAQPVRRWTPPIKEEVSAMTERSDPATPTRPVSRPPDVPDSMTFPQVARLELDELLEQLVARTGR